MKNSISMYLSILWWLFLITSCLETGVLFGLHFVVEPQSSLPPYPQFHTIVTPPQQTNAKFNRTTTKSQSPTPHAMNRSSVFPPSILQFNTLWNAKKKRCVKNSLRSGPEERGRFINMNVCINEMKMVVQRIGNPGEKSWKMPKRSLQ